MTRTDHSGAPLFLETTSADASHHLYPGPAHPRLILPARAHECRASLSLFCSPRARLKYAIQKAVSRRSATYVESPAMHAVKAAAGVPKAVAAVSLGTPGPYNKQSVLLFDTHGHPLSITKVGTNRYTRALLENEARWLSMINGTALVEHAPRLLQSGPVDALFLMTQTIGSGPPSTSTFTQDHAKLLSALHTLSLETGPFKDSAMHATMARRAAMLTEKLDDAWRRRIEIGMHRITRVLGPESIPLTAAHRDFAPWNIRTGEGGLFLYDWEYASTGYIPLYDLFHFVLMPIAVKRQPKIRDAHSALSTAERANTWLAEDPMKICKARDQLIAYLLDVCLFYLESTVGDAVGDNVVQRYGLLIDKLCETENP